VRGKEALESGLSRERTEPFDPEQFPWPMSAPSRGVGSSSGSVLREAVEKEREEAGVCWSHEGRCTEGRDIDDSKSH
jgi:hypothetical protein